MLTLPQRDLLETISPLIQKGLSPQQGIQLESLLKQSTKGAMGASYNIFDPVGGAVNLGIKLAGLYDSGKLKFSDILVGIGAIYVSSHTGLSPAVLYEGGKNLLAQLPSPPQPTTPHTPIQPITTINDKGSNNKKELGGYHCTNEGCGYYEDGICNTC
jgi:hypothetical protein